MTALLISATRKRKAPSHGSQNPSIPIRRPVSACIRRGGLFLTRVLKRALIRGPAWVSSSSIRTAVSGEHHSTRGRLNLRALTRMNEGESCQSWELYQPWPREPPASNPLARLREPWPRATSKGRHESRRTRMSCPLGRDKALGILEGSRQRSTLSIRKGLLRPRETQWASTPATNQQEKPGRRMNQSEMAPTTTSSQPHTCYPSSTVPSHHRGADPFSS